MDYMTLFPGYTRDKPHFAALDAAVLQQVNDLIALVPEMESGLSVAHAVGAQLDALGVSLSIPRQSGWSDDSSTPLASPCPFRARAAGAMKLSGASCCGSSGETSGTG